MSNASLQAYTHAWCAPLIALHHQKQHPCFTPWVQQSAPGARSATFSVQIFSKGATLLGVNQIWAAGFGSSLLTRKSLGKKWHDVQDKCNRWERLRKVERWDSCVRIADRLIAVESLSVNCTSFFAHKYEIASILTAFFPLGCSNWFVFSKLTLCGLVQSNSTGREGWDREEMKAVLR